jgi:hypothetical protein
MPQHHEHEHHVSHDHEHHHGHAHKRKGWHKHWLTWVVVGLMLAAMLMYVLSDNEFLQPGGGTKQQMPAAPAPAAGI